MLYVLVGLTVVALGFSALTKNPTRSTIQLAVLFIVLAAFPSAGARSNVDLTPSYVAIGVLAIGYVFSPKFIRSLLPFLSFLAYLAVGFVLIWGSNNVVRNGIINLTIGVVAWALGSTLSGLTLRDIKLTRNVALLLVLAIALQAVVTSMQSVGIEIFALQGRSESLEGGRANGTFSHPGSLGKAVILLLAMTLPLTRSKDRTTRILANSGLLISIVPIALSASRGNFIALLAMVLTWSLIQLTRRFSFRRLAIPGALGVTSLFFIDAIIARFEADPTGGQRQYLLEVTLHILPRFLTFGVGPSAFVQVFGRYDALIAQDWPVHNTFILLVAETGIVGATLISIPILGLLLRSIRHTWSRTSSAATGGAVVALVPAVVVIGVSGWGLLTPYLFFLLMFVLGWSNQALTKANSLDRPPSSGLVDGLRGPEYDSTRGKKVVGSLKAGEEVRAVSNSDGLFAAAEGDIESETLTTRRR